MIAVVFPNGRQVNVNADELDGLIQRKEIISFLRSSGWVVLDHGPVRSARPTLCIPERRHSAYQKFDLYLKSLTA